MKLKGEQTTRATHTNPHPPRQPFCGSAPWQPGGGASSSLLCCTDGLTPLDGGGHHGPRLKRRCKKREIHSPIKTVVVVVMENRSFDHVLGWLRATRPDIDGLTGKESDPFSPEIFVTDKAG
ncbi:hypothetical protein ZWY2020_027790 [Hordeum vulgare]|nr:hypothetical protein ZWY2020_027790 [Hordeum vulgare]